MNLPLDTGSEKDLARKTSRFFFISTSVMVVTIISNLIFTKFFSTYFSPMDFGFLKVILSTLALIVGLTNMNIGGAIIRFGNPAFIKNQINPSQSLKNIATNSLLILAIIFAINIVILMLITLLGFQLFDTANYDVFVLIIIGILFPKVLIYYFSSWGLARQHFSFFMYGGLVIAFETILSVILALIINIGVFDVLIVYFVVDMFFSFIGIIFLLKIVGIGSISSKVIKSIINFTGPTFLVVIAIRFFEFLSIYILYLFSSSEEAAFYSIALSTMIGLRLIEKLKTESLFSIQMQIYDSEGDKSFIAFLSNISRLYLVLLLSIGLITFQLSSIIIILLSNDQYLPASSYIIYLVIGIVAESIQGFLSYIAIAKKRMVELSIVQLVSIVSGIIIMILIVPVIGPIGVGMSIAAVSIIKMILVFFISRRMIRFTINKIKVASVLILLLLSLFVFDFFIELGFNIIVASLISIIFYYVFVIVTGIIKINEIKKYLRLLIVALLPKKS
jgi:O-antigen/teichoic acid export membrane protein